MKAGRIGLYVAGAVVGAGFAYLLTLLPNHGPASSETPKPVAKKGDGKGRAPAAPVTAATVMASDMPVILVAPGTVEPFANVAVKTRVDGQIVEVLFREGDLVNQGDVLFRLDDRMVKAQISQAEASIAKDQASLRDAEATLARREALVGKKIVTEAAADQARYAVEGLKASIAAGQALLESQKTQLDYLTIRAPITGRTGGLSSKAGAMVRGVDAALPLVVINQTKPIWVTFAVPQGELGALRRALAAKALADISVPGGAKPVVVQGTIGFVDNQVDKQTGTITARVIAENADEVLWPGLSAEVALTVEMKRGLAGGACHGSPARAAGHDQLGDRARQQGRAARGGGRAHRRPDGVSARRRQGRRAGRHGWPDPPGPGRGRHYRGAAPPASRPCARIGRAAHERQRLVTR